MKRERRRDGKMDRTKGRKVTLLLSAETDTLLTFSAKIRNVDRSARAEKLLRDALAGDKMLASYLAAVAQGRSPEAGEGESAA
jgi:hypothetical protein